MSLCGHTAAGFDGGSFTCYKPAGHRGWHEESVRLRNGYIERTNWGDDGLAPHSSKDNARRQSESPSRRWGDEALHGTTLGGARRGDGVTLSELRRLAEKLEEGNAHGPWVWHHAYPQQVTNGAAVLIAECWENPDRPSEIAEFIAAANPRTVLALLACAEAMERIATFASQYGPSDEAEIARAALAALDGEQA